MKTEDIILFADLLSGEQPVLVHPAINDIYMDTIRQFYKGQTPRGNLFGKRPAGYYSPVHSTAEQGRHQLPIVSIGVIKLEQGTSIYP